jgi:hypothetical protein
MYGNASDGVVGEISRVQCTHVSAEVISSELPSHFLLSYFQHGETNRCNSVKKFPSDISQLHTKSSLETEETKTFWEELIAYFPLSRYGPDIKRLQDR